MLRSQSRLFSVTLGHDAATRRRAWTLLGLCWFVTVISALEMEMWLPWGLANPCVMAVTHLRLPVSIAGVAVAVLVVGRCRSPPGRPQVDPRSTPGRPHVDPMLTPC